MAILYRAEVEHIVVLQDSEYPGIRFTEFEILRETPKGYCILDEDGLERWISKDGRYASLTKGRAVERLRFRKRDYAKHCVRRLPEAMKACRELEVEVYPRTEKVFRALESLEL